MFHNYCAIHQSKFNSHVSNNESILVNRLNRTFEKTALCVVFTDESQYLLWSVNGRFRVWSMRRKVLCQDFSLETTALGWWACDGLKMHLLQRQLTLNHHSAFMDL